MGWYNSGDKRWAIRDKMNLTLFRETFFKLDIYMSRYLLRYGNHVKYSNWSSPHWTVWLWEVWYGIKLIHETVFILFFFNLHSQIFQQSFYGKSDLIIAIHHWAAVMCIMIHNVKNKQKTLYTIYCPSPIQTLSQFHFVSQISVIVLVCWPLPDLCVPPAPPHHLHQGGGWVFGAAVGAQPKPAGGCRGRAQPGPGRSVPLPAWEPLNPGHRRHG